MFVEKCMSYSKLISLTVLYLMINKNVFLVTLVDVPHSGKNLKNLDKRMKWNTAFEKYINRLKTKKEVIICGDLNVAHGEIGMFYLKVVRFRTLKSHIPNNYNGNDSDILYIGWKGGKTPKKKFFYRRAKRKNWSGMPDKHFFPIVTNKKCLCIVCRWSV